jgi:hypothetical protein
VALTSEDRERFLASLRSDAAFRDEVRREVLTSELLELPERFAAFVEEMHAFVEEMHAFVEASDRRFEALEKEMSRQVDYSGQLRGMILEQKIRDNPGYYLSRYAKRVKVRDLDDLLEEFALTDLSDDEYGTLGRTDILATGRSHETGTVAVYVVEATWRVHTGDVDRQVARREILAGRGVDVVAVIASSEKPSDPVRRYASTNGVLLQNAQDADAA